ncbi:hypothetical protein TSUD_399410 [Trifolium subterraneum]|uniref:HMA domain-containing protein n=2 Tax=Trifolium TaxID=3898 RepID=A0A2Z6NPC1_TRISU|nr:hypothetical protein TSUD_399410 [Trifolium subterraneum]
MGALDYLSNFCDTVSVTTSTIKRSKRKAMQTVEIKVRMDCDGCERRVRNAVTSLKGVKSVEVNRKQSRVIVSGYVDPNKVLKRVKSTGKVRAQFWPYVEQHLVYYPYAYGAYDRRAPSGFVRNVMQTASSNNHQDENLVSLFSDDNVNACSIM